MRMPTGGVLGQTPGRVEQKLGDRECSREIMANYHGLPDRERGEGAAGTPAESRTWRSWGMRATEAAGIWWNQPGQAAAAASEARAEGQTLSTTSGSASAAASGATTSEKNRWHSSSPSTNAAPGAAASSTGQPSGSAWQWSQKATHGWQGGGWGSGWGNWPQTSWSTSWSSGGRPGPEDAVKTKPDTSDPPAWPGFEH